MISALFAVLFSAAALVSADASCARSYTVKEGDYCDLISAANNASTYQLAVANYQTINDGCTNLDVGENLCLGITGQDCQSTYTVLEGDSCDAIAQKFGLNDTLLISNNPQIDEACDNIYIGEVLCVAQTSLVTPAPSGWTLPGTNLDDGSGTPATATTTTSAAAMTTTTPAVVDNNANVATTTTSAAASSSTDDTDDCDDGDDDDTTDSTDDTDDTDDGDDDCDD